MAVARGVAPQLLEPAAVALQHAGELIVHCLHLAPQRLCFAERRDEELCKAVQRGAQGVWLALKVERGALLRARAGGSSERVPASVGHAQNERESAPCPPAPSPMPRLLGARVRAAALGAEVRVIVVLCEVSGARSGSGRTASPRGGAGDVRSSPLLTIGVLGAAHEEHVLEVMAQALEMPGVGKVAHAHRQCCSRLFHRGGGRVARVGAVLSHVLVLSL